MLTGFRRQCIFLSLMLVLTRIGYFSLTRLCSDLVSVLVRSRALVLH